MYIDKIYYYLGVLVIIRYNFNVSDSVKVNFRKVIES